MKLWQAQIKKDDKRRAALQSSTLKQLKQSPKQLAPGSAIRVAVAVHPMKEVKQSAPKRPAAPRLGLSSMPPMMAARIADREAAEAREAAKPRLHLGGKLRHARR